MTPTINLVATGQKIKTLRKQKHITVKQLQEALGFNNSTTIYKWQQGKCLPTIDNIVILAKVLQVKIEDILVLNE